MRRRGQFEANTKRTRTTSAEQAHATALQCVLDSNAEELLWLAEVMAGSRPTGEQCLAEAIDLAVTAQYVGREWMLSWVKRLLVHVALKRIGGEIGELLPPAETRGGVALSRADATIVNRQQLRAIPPPTIVASLDVLERTCFVLDAYLGYSVLDCALLLGCPRAWIEPVCARVLSKIVDPDNGTQGRFREFDPFISTGVRGCAG